MRLPGSDAVRMALQVPIRNPGRSTLTALGLAIGVGAFIAMVSFGQGARSSVVSQFETLGSNMLRVKTRYGSTERAPRPLTETDVEALRRESTAIEVVVPHAFRSMQITAGAITHRSMVRGTIPEFTRTREWRMRDGGLFDQVDMVQRAKVCVLGATTAKQLFGHGDPLGQTITVEGRLPCRVIGVLAARGSSISGSDMDDRVVMPVSTFEAHLGMPRGYWVLEVKPKSRALLDAAKHEVTRVLRRTHQLGPEEQDDFQIISPDEVTRVAEQIGGILTGLLAGIAGVSLLVGGIGIMNIQLVSVAERTHEIGIRAAVGAAPHKIMRQFLAEALVLAAIGAGAGVALGVGIAMLVADQMGWPSATSSHVVLGSAAFGIAVGTIFGYIPARRAAALDPIDALRRE